MSMKSREFPVDSGKRLALESLLLGDRHIIGAVKIQHVIHHAEMISPDKSRRRFVGDACTLLENDDIKLTVCRCLGCVHGNARKTLIPAFAGAGHCFSSVFLRYYNGQLFNWRLRCLLSPVMVGFVLATSRESKTRVPLRASRGGILSLPSVTQTKMKWRLPAGCTQIACVCDHSHVPGWIRAGASAIGQQPSYGNPWRRFWMAFLGCVASQLGFLLVAVAIIATLSSRLSAEPVGTPTVADFPFSVLRQTNTPRVSFASVMRVGQFDARIFAIPVGRQSWAFDAPRFGRASPFQSVKDEAIAELRINHTTFRIPQQYVGYYDTKNHSVLGLHFLLPAVTPIEPFSIGVPFEHKPNQVADLGIQIMKWPDPDPYLDRLAAQGKLQTTDYGFGLQEVPASALPGPTQNETDPDMREFLGVTNGQRVTIDCSGFRLGGLFVRCRYAFSLPNYALSIDIPASFLPKWNDILSALINYAASHEKK